MGRRNRRRVKDDAPREGLIVDLTHEGFGVVRPENGKAVFVDGALPGERVLYQSTWQQSKYDEADLLEVLEASSDRVTPKCAHVGVCGGCALQHLAPDAQLRMKEGILRGNLTRIAKVEPDNWLPPLSAEVWGYRRKARLGVKNVPAKGRVLVGFRERKMPYIAALERCLVLDPRVGELLMPLSTLIGSLSIRRALPQIEVAISDDVVGLALRVMEPPTPEDEWKLLEFAEQHGVSFWLQPKGPDSIVPLRAPAPELLYQLPDQNVSFAFQPSDFIQVNAGMNRKMVKRALELLDLHADSRVLELFAGLGNFTLPLARQAASVTTVEADQALVQRAEDNAQRNGLDNIHACVGDLYSTDELDAARQSWLKRGYDRLLLDPPRSGAREVLPALARLRIPRIVYVSCHPGTLARDAATLVHDQGYRLVQVGVMDMFPHTAHVESIAIFELS